MMMKLTCDVLAALEGKTLSVAESCTGGMIGAAITAVPGSSKVFKGGIISYTNEVKARLLKVPVELLDREGAVSLPVAKAMAEGVRQIMRSDYGLSVTGLAGPGGDEFANPVGTVFIGCADSQSATVERFLFRGSREEIRVKAAEAALQILLQRL